MAASPEIARENGKKGGRPRGYVSIQAEKSRELIVRTLESHLTPIVEKAIQQAKKGDRYAREWLMERGYGKVAQAIVPVDEEGNVMPIAVINVVAINSNDAKRKSS